MGAPSALPDGMVADHRAEADVGPSAKRQRATGFDDPDASVQEEEGPFYPPRRRITGKQAPMGWYAHFKDLLPEIEQTPTGVDAAVEALDLARRCPLGDWSLVGPEESPAGACGGSPSLSGVTPPASSAEDDAAWEAIVHRTRAPTGALG